MVKSNIFHAQNHVKSHWFRRISTAPAVQRQASGKPRQALRCLLLLRSEAGQIFRETRGRMAKEMGTWWVKWEMGNTHIYTYIYIYTCIYNIHIYVYIHVYTINEVVSISSTQCFSMGLKLPPMLKHTSMEDASGETWPLVSLTPPFSWRHNTTFVCISLVHVDMSDPSQFYMISFHIS